MASSMVIFKWRSLKFSMLYNLYVKTFNFIEIVDKICGIAPHTETLSRVSLFLLEFKCQSQHIFRNCIPFHVSPLMPGKHMAASFW